jgi:hypothetical protein
MKGDVYGARTHHNEEEGDVTTHEVNPLSVASSFSTLIEKMFEKYT